MVLHNNHTQSTRRFAIGGFLIAPHSAIRKKTMIRGLNKVSWEQVNVSFKGSKQRYFAHNTIQDPYCWRQGPGLASPVCRSHFPWWHRKGSLREEMEGGDYCFQLSPSATNASHRKWKEQANCLF